MALWLDLKIFWARFPPPKRTTREINTLIARANGGYFRRGRISMLPATGVQSPIEHFPCVRTSFWKPWSSLKLCPGCEAAREKLKDKKGGWDISGHYKKNIKKWKIYRPTHCPDQYSEAPHTREMVTIFIRDPVVRTRVMDDKGGKNNETPLYVGVARAGNKSPFENRCVPFFKNCIVWVGTFYKWSRPLFPPNVPKEEIWGPIRNFLVRWKFLIVPARKLCMNRPKGFFSKGKFQIPVGLCLFP